jgi:hypothetical protein
VPRLGKTVMAWDLVNVEAMSYDLLLNGVAWEWETVPEYVAAIKRRGIALNVAMMVPLSALRFYVMGEASTQRAANGNEIEEKGRLLREAIAAGALWLFTEPCQATHWISGPSVVRPARQPGGVRSAGTGGARFRPRRYPAQSSARPAGTHHRPILRNTLSTLPEKAGDR